MPSDIKGVWELVTEGDSKVLYIFTGTHFAFVSNRLGGRGYIGTYTTEGNRLHVTRMVSAPPNPLESLTLEFQRDSDTLTTRIVDEGTVMNVGHADTYRKIAD
jgi:hypothetical protein